MNEEPVELDYQVIVKGPGINVNRSVRVETAASVVTLVMGGDVPSHKPADMGHPKESRSLREYLIDVEARRNPDKITAIGAFLTDRGQESFTRTDIRGQFRAAGEPVPANFARDFSLTLSSGWIAPDPESPGGYFVTQTGRGAINKKFAVDLRRQVRRRKRSRQGGGE